MTQRITDPTQLFELAVADEQYERARVIKNLVKVKLNLDNLQQ